MEENFSSMKSEQESDFELQGPGFEPHVEHLLEMGIDNGWVALSA